jgi:hypothetical protein
MQAREIAGDRIKVPHGGNLPPRIQYNKGQRRSSVGVLNSMMNPFEPVSAYDIWYG